MHASGLSQLPLPPKRLLSFPRSHGGRENLTVLLWLSVHLSLNKGKDHSCECAADPKGGLQALDEWTHACEKGEKLRYVP